MSEKKFVRRSVAVASGVICVLLAVGLVVVLAMLSNANSTITQKDNTISDKDNQISTKDNLISIEENQIDSLTNVTLLRDSLVWSGHQATTELSGSYSTFGTNTVSYAGYLSINVESSTTPNAYVRVIWSSHGISFDQQLTVGSTGTALFPVLPTSKIELIIGNTDPSGGTYQNQTITVTFYY